MSVSERMMAQLYVISITAIFLNPPPTQLPTNPAATESSDSFKEAAFPTRAQILCALSKENVECLYLIQHKEHASFV